VQSICQVGIFTEAAEIPTRSCLCEIRESEREFKSVLLGSAVADFPAVGATRRFWFLRFRFHIY
jgi:hypothetical protein